MKRGLWAVLLVGLVLTFGLVACGDGNGVEATATALAAATDPPADTPGQEQESTSLGEWVEGSGLAMVAHTVEDPAVPNPEYYEPREGARLVAVEFELGCLANSHIVQAQETRLIDNLGRKHEAIYGAMADHRAIGSGEIAMGERVRGWLAYELPDGRFPQSLEYAPTVWGRNIRLEVSLVE